MLRFNLVSVQIYCKNKTKPNNNSLKTLNILSHYNHKIQCILLVFLSIFFFVCVQNSSSSVRLVGKLLPTITFKFCLRFSFQYTVGLDFDSAIIIYEYGKV